MDIVFSKELFKSENKTVTKIDPQNTTIFTPKLIDDAGYNTLACGADKVYSRTI